MTAPASDRAAAAAAFLDAAGWGEAARAPLAGDASARRYERLTGGPGGARAVLMDADPARGEDAAAFLALTGLLRGAGFSAPAVLAARPAEGFALLEDLGDALFARVCAADPAAEPALYAAAVDLLAALHAEPPPAVAEGAGCAFALPPYDRDFLLLEAALAADWWADAAGRPFPADARAEYLGLVGQACAGADADRSALVLRDYHAENLVWLPDRAGLARVGLLDYQGARIGSPAYDLASLLGDARRDVGPETDAAMRDRYAAAARARDPHFDAEGFAAACAALGAQRNLKILGVFARLARRDGKPGYLALVPRVWRTLARDLAHPALGALRAFVAARVPEPDAAALARVAG
jgi:aminoglycoside/choline kinase family phosphotransferase